MNMIKGLIGVALAGAAIASAAVLVLKKNKESEEENVIFTSTKEFNEENTDIEVSENEDQAVDIEIPVEEVKEEAPEETTEEVAEDTTEEVAEDTTEVTE